MPKPEIPDACELPCAINGWLYDTDDTSNGHVWRSSEHDCSIGVFDTIGSVAVRVTDDRVSGFASNITLERIDYDDDRDAALVDGFAAACEWMTETDPDAWSHPDVCEAVFDAPPGYALETYYLENREAIVYYRDLAFDGDRPTRRVPDEYSRENCPYLYVHEWRGSGSATVALTPWTEAHGPGSRHPEIESVVETPSECGLEVAVTMARQWAREHTEGEIDADATGQAGLEGWSA
ncbi:hypothetical protein [Halopiger xanaduensis]|uniref:Uncharacterized protein n=1 Tax=Halopiger xanaduensis (strain DSM 18323 / JCM 14033 / SH-6) TaxID=797210 RepID=F8DES5_HALXS|nr:hypothetical protein [Halopiger xanaduensis]AEH39515.1 hypothetical protein Halxa_0275 [Halopiger xanaduensis SH-6]